MTIKHSTQGQQQFQDYHTASDVPESAPSTSATAPANIIGPHPTSPMAPTPAVPKVSGKRTRYTVTLIHRSHLTISVEQKSIIPISTKTSDIFGAGTDANVFVQMTGEQGVSDVIQLKNSENHAHKFQRNQSDIFITDEIGDVGPIIEVHIWHDNKGLGASWHLDTVEICDACSNVIYQFKCNRWLSKLRDDGQLRRALQLSGTREKVSRLRSLKFSKRSLKETTTATTPTQQHKQSSENSEAVSKTPSSSSLSSSSKEPEKVDKKPP
uniref:PLAT domain-containing protein n=1 Tax=Romanomermis culicivorax TaxID=13658 RepID=A0A915KHK6_ROMCU